MGELLNIVTPLHKKTKRDYLERMQDEKIHCMEVAKQYEKDYWDGDRRYGYGGYRYDGRWKVVAESLIEKYQLKKDASLLDVGCGKAFLLHELKKLLPEATVKGMDLSRHGLQEAKEEVKSQLILRRAEEVPYPYEDNEFDLVISLMTFHNLKVFDLKKAVQEVERVGKQKVIMVESYRNETELFNLQCWALTCEAFFTPEEWVWLFDEWGYTGDYEFIYFE